MAVAKYKSLNIHDDEIHDLRMQTIEESMPTTNTVITCKSPPIIDGSSQNDLISELQNRIGGTNKGALQLLEQLRRSLATSRGANIHLNPDMILNSPYYLPDTPWSYSVICPTHHGPIQANSLPTVEGNLLHKTTGGTVWIAFEVNELAIAANSCSVK
uniref:Uncharacterized protein n=1 Tax=Ascaris lumbricoides TaxID=6252 RepID=A0A0M3IHI8_ASCLU